MGDAHNDEAMHRLQALQSQLEAADAWQLRTRVETTIAQLGGWTAVNAKFFGDNGLVTQIEK